MGRFRLILIVMAMALIASSCHVLIDVWAPGSALRPYYCDPTDTAINDGHAMMPGMPPSPSEASLSCRE